MGFSGQQYWSRVPLPSPNFFKDFFQFMCFNQLPVIKISVLSSLTSKSYSRVVPVPFYLHYFITVVVKLLSHVPFFADGSVN